jgi:hypothetical protein
MALGEPICNTCRMMWNGHTCLQPFDCRAPFRAGWLQRQVEFAEKQKAYWLVQRLKNNVPNGLYGARVNDAGEVV